MEPPPDREHRPSQQPRRRGEPDFVGLIAILASAQAGLPVLVRATPREDHAYRQPWLTAKKLRRLTTAGVPGRQGRRGIWAANRAMSQAVCELAGQAELTQQRSVRLAGNHKNKSGCERVPAPGTVSDGPGV